MSTSRRSASKTFRCVARSTCLVLALGVSAAAGEARADQPDVALGLFEEAKELMAAEKYGEACAKLEQSEKLEHGAGTLLVLALCHEKTHKNFSAWTKFKRVVDESQDPEHRDRREYAEKQAALLAPMISEVVIQVPSAARVLGLVVRRDDVEIPAPLFETALKVDGGEHVISASAPGKVAWEQRLQVAAEKDSQTVTVPILADLPRPQAPSGAPARLRRIVGFALGGAGVASVVVGAVFGAQAISKIHEANSACPANPCPSIDTRDAAARAHQAANGDAAVANILVGAGAVAMLGGALLVLTALPPKSDHASAGIRVAPMLGHSTGGARMEWTF